jgi:hypothetical protein
MIYVPFWCRKIPGTHKLSTLSTSMLASGPSDAYQRIIRWTSSNSVTTNGIPAQGTWSYMEDTHHSASVKKPKNTGDTFLTARRCMRATIEMPHGKKSKRTCKCGDSRQTSGHQWKRDFSTYHKTYKNQQAHHYLSKHPLTQSEITYGQPSKNKTQSSGRPYSRDACHTSGSNSPPRTSARKSLAYTPNNGAPNSPKKCGTTPSEYGNAAMMLSVETQTHMSNTTN